MVDLPLVDEDAGILGDEVAIERRVFCGAETKKRAFQSQLVIITRVTTFLTR